MSRHLLVGRFGPLDTSAVQSAADELVTTVDLVAGKQRLDHGLGHALDHLVDIGVFPTELGLDVAVLAVLVHAADTRLQRETASEDSWTREIRLVVPVSDPGRWTPAAPRLQRMLDFLSGDRWQIGFRARPTDFARVAPGRVRGAPPPFDVVSLFSGGADSLVGAIDLLEQGSEPLFVSHAGDGATSAAQDRCFDGLEAAYPGRAFARLRVWTVLKEGLVAGVGSESTMRGRSFLFIALGVLAASGLSAPFTVAVPENGFIALNVPLDPLRVGSLSTKTTHPFYLGCWNDLLADLGFNGQVANPYAERTKGEMITGCRNPTLARTLLPQSLSCASPSKARWLGRATEQCGHCLPCLIRRAALTAAWGAGGDPTPYTLAALTARTLNSLEAEGQQVRSFQFAASRLRAQPALARLLVHKPGPLTGRGIDVAALADVYSRGLLEVDALLAGVRTEPA